MAVNVDLYEDADGEFHYQAYNVGEKNARSAPTLCNRPVDGMRKAAWFPVNDPRGRVHHERGCDTCRARLAI